MKTFLIMIFLTSITLLQPKKNPTMTKEETYKAYSSLMGGVWETKGKWQSGAEYHQEIIVDMKLTKNIFTVKTYDHIDSKQFDNSQRNYGIRAWDSKEKKMKFWEFDVYGGITNGEVFIANKHIYHIYEYPDNKGGVKTLADAWIYVDKDTYIFKICEYSDGKLGKEYMSSTYKRK